MPNYHPHVRVDRPVASSPELVIGYQIRMSDPYSIRLLIQQLHDVLEEHTIDGRWIQHD